MKRIIDANLNRACEALRVLEEIARFLVEDKNISADLKNIRHTLNSLQDADYAELLLARDTEGDIGASIKNRTEKPVKITKQAVTEQPESGGSCIFRTVCGKKSAGKGRLII